MHDGAPSFQCTHFCAPPRTPPCSLEHQELERQLAEQAQQAREAKAAEAEDPCAEVREQLEQARSQVGAWQRGGTAPCLKAACQASQQR